MSVGARSWKVIKPHIPLIKFNRRGINSKQTSGTMTSTHDKGKAVFILEDDTHLPARYHRKPLTQQEIEYIERGGPE
ncbi:alpha-ketoglutarate dehydrogenase component 4 isoform X2 [Parasteatoda tepidariorum]|uniref:alpha-ketoglutarate dehydrogenase component 4 isoform X2 n=1 Tax=Parasteatoda tepidariorum TaxID=114398 RepID=UPI001C725087|nr:28S ribosomal protein S36, mitochondrial isoform X4 [Parasteatoda tepidariorum]